MVFDKNGFLDEPCVSCDKPYLELNEWHCNEKECPHKTECKKVKINRKLIKINKVFCSFILALYIITMPFMCALSYTLNWSIDIKIIFTLATLSCLIWGTVLIYPDIEE